MTSLTFKDIRYIRAALECKLESLRWALEQDNVGTLDPPLTDDEGCDMENDFLYYDKLLYWFQQWEKQTVPLRPVPKEGCEEGKKNANGRDV